MTTSTVDRQPAAFPEPDHTAATQSRRILWLLPQFQWWVQAKANKDISGYDLSIKQRTVLYLVRSQGATLSLMAKRMMVAPTVLTGIVDRLERRGLLRRENDPTDRRKLRQVVMNLVGNARKFTARGVIEVRAAADGPSGGVRLTVRDTGSGIDAAHLPYVFDLYRQAPSERRNEGCGLGLYIVRRYVELLGGSVSCASTVGTGTTFVVLLPASVPAASSTTIEA